jgi:phytoene dehydrogenase-like protein
MIDAAIVGAGLAGLNCAAVLERAGLNVIVLEASDAPGGRVRTDVVEGFRLDRGFQVLLTAYPEAERVLDYEALQLKPMTAGALVWHGGKMHRFADPFRQPLRALGSLFDGVVPLGDKLRVASLREQVRQGEIAELFASPEMSTLAFLRGHRFSEAMIDRFFRPFFGGVFLERELATSSRYFQFLFRMFSCGPVAVPELGMGAIPQQMAAALKPGTLVTGATVSSVERTGDCFRIQIRQGREVRAKAAVLAAGVQNASLAVAPLPQVWNRTTTIYFLADRAPVEEPTLVLSGEGAKGGPINHLAVMSRVSAGYAPAGAELVAANVLGEVPENAEDRKRLEEAVRAHAQRIFGAQVARWKQIGVYAIRAALPLTREAEWESRPVARTREGMYLCGDVLETPSIQGALVSGRRVAEAVLCAQ